VFTDDDVSNTNHWYMNGVNSSFTGNENFTTAYNLEQSYVNAWPGYYGDTVYATSFYSTHLPHLVWKFYNGTLVCADTIGLVDVSYFWSMCWGDGDSHVGASKISGTELGIYTTADGERCGGTVEVEVDRATVSIADQEDFLAVPSSGGLLIFNGDQEELIFVENDGTLHEIGSFFDHVFRAGTAYGDGYVDISAVPGSLDGSNDTTFWAVVFDAVTDDTLKVKIYAVVTDDVAGTATIVDSSEFIPTSGPTPTLHLSDWQSCVNPCLTLAGDGFVFTRRYWADTAQGGAAPGSWDTAGMSIHILQDRGDLGGTWTEIILPLSSGAAGIIQAPWSTVAYDHADSVTHVIAYASQSGNVDYTEGYLKDTVIAIPNADPPIDHYVHSGNLLGGDNLCNSAAMTANQYLYIFFDSATSSARTVLCYSTDYGYTWDVASINIFDPYDGDYNNIIALPNSDTAYVTNGANEQPPIIGKIYEDTRILIDTVDVTVLSWSWGKAINITNDTVVYFTDIGSGVDAQFVVYTDNARVSQDVTWVAPTDTLDHAGSPQWKMAPGYSGLFAFDVFATNGGPRLLYYHPDTAFEFVDLSDVIHETDNRDIWITTKPDEDTIIAICWETPGDSAMVRVGYFAPVDSSWTTLYTYCLSDNTYATSTSAIANNQRRAVAAWYGDSLACFYKSWDNTDNLDSTDIMWKVSGNNGSSWSAERNLKPAVDGDSVITLQCPLWFDHSETTDIVWVVYARSTESALGANPFYFVSDTLEAASGEAPNRKRRRRDFGYILNGVLNETHMETTAIRSNYIDRNTR